MTMTPPTPPWLDELNFIRFYMAHACESPWFAYIEFANEPAHKIAIELLQFDMVQFCQTLFRPVHIRTHRHGRRGSKNGKHRGGIPDLNDIIADELYLEEFDVIGVYQVERGILIDFLEIADRVFYELWITTSLVDLPYYTLLGVIGSDKANCPHIGRMYRTADQIFLTTPSTNWQPLNVPNREYSFGVNSPTGFGVGIYSGSFCVTFAAHCHAAAGGDTPCEFRLRNPNTGEVFASFGPFTAAPDSDFDLLMSGHVGEGNYCVWEGREGGPGIILNDVRALCLQVGE
jgi:hypothetical protein